MARKQSPSASRRGEARGDRRDAIDDRSHARARGAPDAVLFMSLVLIGVVAYANSLHGVFLFDDVHHIVENERIRTLAPLSHLLAVRRPVVELSLAINYAVGGLDPRGYHVVNIAIHLLAGLTLFGVVRRTLSLAATRATTAAASATAFVISAIWIVHPLQTQSVTYVIQRGESLMGLFYLLTIYGLIRGASAGGRRLWYVAAVVACALGMGSKGVMVTAPIVALLFDAVFLAGSLGTALRRRWGLSLGLAATWMVLVQAGVVRGVLSASRPSGTVGFSYSGSTPWEYLLTQPGVIRHYLRLALWPNPLCLDYGWPVARSLAAVALPAAILVAILGVVVWAIVRRPKLGFLGAWFFVILAPTSSIIPIQDPAYEHRMYLPLAAVIALVVLALRFLLDRASAQRQWADRSRRAWASTVAAIAVLLLVILTIRRNAVYADELRMWNDVVAQRPDNARAQYNLGRQLDDRGRSDEAFDRYRRAVQLNSAFALAHNNLGMALLRRGEAGEALEHFQRAVLLKPRYADAQNNLGAVLVQIGRIDEAIAPLESALRIDPAIVPARYSLGIAFARRGDFAAAAVELAEVTDRDPSFAAAQFDLGRVWGELGRYDEASEAFRATLRLEPDHAEAARMLRAAEAASGSTSGG